MEEFAGELALLAADDFGHGQALGDAAVDVGLAMGVITQSHDGGDMQAGDVDPVAAAV